MVLIEKLKIKAFVYNTLFQGLSIYVCPNSKKKRPTFLTPSVSIQLFDIKVRNIIEAPETILKYFIFPSPHTQKISLKNMVPIPLPLSPRILFSLHLQCLLVTPAHNVVSLLVTPALICSAVVVIKYTAQHLQWNFRLLETSCHIHKESIPLNSHRSLHEKPVLLYLA